MNLSEYKDAGFSVDALSKIQEIVEFVNRMPIETKQQQEDLFNFMIKEYLTSKKDEAWVEDKET